MKYEIDYVFLPKGETKTEEIGGINDMVMGDDHGFGIVPQVGDYVEIPRSRMGEREVYKGKVCRRTFRHVLGYVYVRIVLAEVEEKDWSNQSC